MTPQSTRVREVIRSFGLPRGDARGSGAITHELVARSIPGPGQLTLLTGASGSGKSSLLQAMRQSVDGSRWHDLDEMRLPDVAVVDLFPSMTVPDCLAWLSRFGLAEAWTWVRRPAQLSEGQRWRLKLARAVEMLSRDPWPLGSHPLLVSDEFTAVLDRVSAAIIAHTLAQVLRELRVDHAPGVIIATSHDDVAGAVKADLVVRCDFELYEAA